MDDSEEIRPTNPANVACLEPLDNGLDVRPITAFLSRADTVLLAHAAMASGGHGLW